MLVASLHPKWTQPKSFIFTVFVIQLQIYALKLFLAVVWLYNGLWSFDLSKPECIQDGPSSLPDFWALHTHPLAHGKETNQQRTEAQGNLRAAGLIMHIWHYQKCHLNVSRVDMETCYYLPHLWANVLLRIRNFSSCFSKQAGFVSEEQKLQNVSLRSSVKHAISILVHKAEGR